MKKLLALLSTAPLALTACGGGSSTEGVIAKSVTTVVAEGTVSDGTFNQSVNDGANAVKDTLKLAVSNVELKTGDAEKLKTGISGQLEKGMETLLLPGFTHGTKQLDELAKTATDRNFVLFDANGYVDGTNFVAYNNPRIASVLYDVHQAAFIAGYLAAKYYDSISQTLKLGMFGGMKFPSVYSFMAGAKAGVLAYNTDNSTSHQVINLGSVDDHYSGSFAPGGGTAKANELITKGANVLLPVAGPQTKDAIDVVKGKANHFVIGVDVDATNLYKDDASLILTSITKGLKKSTERILSELYGTTPDRKSFGTTTTGNLDNEEIGIVFNTSIQSSWYDAALKTKAKAAPSTDTQFA